MAAAAPVNSPTQLIKAARYAALGSGLIFGYTKAKYVKRVIASREAKGIEPTANPWGYHGPPPTVAEYDAFMTKRFGPNYTKEKTGKYRFVAPDGGKL